MSVQLGGIVLDAPDPQALAAFYGELLGWDVEWHDDTWVQLRHGGRPVLSVAKEPAYVAPTWPTVPGTQQMQTHLDLLVDDLDAEAARAVALGAREAEQQFSEGIRIMTDPAGHVFCLFLEGY